MSLELVLLVPVLVLMTVFVLWAGRGGQVALTADLAAEEAATAAALCCEEDSGGAAGREALVEDVLEARPGLGFLCIGGPRPDAGGGSDGFLSEHWLKFEPGRDTGGVGVLGVQFLCETDGAVAPLRGLFPTVTFHGQAAEVVLREPRFIVGFEPTRVEVTEGTDAELVFTVVVEPAFGEDVTLSYGVVDPDTTVESGDFQGTDFADLTGTVEIPTGESSAQIVLRLVDDGFYEGTEELVLNLTGVAPSTVVLDDDRKSATGVIEDDDRKPFLQILPPDPEVDEGGDPAVPDDGDLVFRVRLGGVDGLEAANDVEVTVQVSTVADPAAKGLVCAAWMDSTDPCEWASPNDDYVPVSARPLTFPAGVRSDGDLTLEVLVRTVDDKASPEGEPTEVVVLELSGESGAPVRQEHGLRGGRILDDEATLTAADASTVEGNDPDAFEELVFRLGLDRAPTAPVVVGYELRDDMRSQSHGATAGSDCAVAGTDYLLWDHPVNPGEFTRKGTVTIDAGVQRASIPAVRICGDRLVEHEETLRLEVTVVSGEAIEAPPPDDSGAWGTILNDDDIPVVSIEPAQAEGVEGQDERLEFTVRLSGRDLNGNVHTVEIIEDITVDYTIGGSSATATAPGLPDADYAVTLDGAELDALEGRLRFTAGRPAVTEHVFAVQLLADYLPEVRETLRLELHSLNDPTGAAVVGDGDPATDDSHADAAIVEDPPPALTVDSGGDREGETVVFTVTLAHPRGKTVVVPYSLVGGTGAGEATAGTDFEAVAPARLTGGTLMFGPAVTDTERTVEVRLLHDTVDDPREAFRLELLELGDPTMAVRADSDPDEPGDQFYGVGTITNVDPPALSVGDFTGPEGTDGSFVVTLANARTDETVTVDYAISGDEIVDNEDTATAPGHRTKPADFEAAPGGSLSGRLTFPDGAAQLPDGSLWHSVGVSLLPDSILEPDETLRLVLRNPSQAAVLADRDPVTDGVQAYGVGTITNVDAVPYLFVDDATAREGELLTFTVTLCSPTPDDDVTVRYQVESRSAKAGLDFEAAPGGSLSGTLTFPATMDAQVSEGCGGADAKSLTVRVATLRDSVEDSDEEVHLVLSAATPAGRVGLRKAIGVGRIINVSAATVRVSDPTAVEGLPLVFTVSLVDNDGNPAVITAPVTVYYATADRTATARADYTAVPANPGPCLSAAPPSGCPFVTFVPADNPTPANPDPANRRHTVSVPTTADRLDEDDETVALVLRLAQGTENAGLGDTEGTGTIEDADPPALRITDASAEEGQPLTFEVTLVDTNGDLTSTSEDVTVLIYTEDSTATAGSDYTAVPRRPRRQLSIPAGRTSLLDPFEVDTVLDDDVEDPETFKVVLSGARNAKIDRAVAVGTINPRCVKINPAPGEMADNMPPTITVHHVTVTEGATYFLTVSFSRPLCDDFYLFRQSLTGSAWGTASVPDFWSSSSGARDESLHYAHESECCRQTLVSFVANDDDLDEDDEWYTLRVQWGPSMPPHYQAPGLGWVTGRVTILDNDDLSRLSVADSSADEGDTMAFTITKDRESGRLVTVQYRTVPASGTATARDDYIEVPWSTVTFQPRRFAYTDFLSGEFRFLPGETVKTFDVATVDDGAGDSGETFQVELRAHPWEYVPLNALIVDGVAVGTILEGDLPELRIHDASADERTTMRLRVELSEPAAQTVTVDYATVERPEGPRAAVEGADYEPVVRRQLEFLAGETVKFAEVVVKLDAVTEVDETFLVELANPNGAALADPSAVGTINGDTTCIDWTVEGAAPPALTVTSPGPGAGEDDGHITFTVRLSEPVCETASFRAGDTGDPRLSVARPVGDYVSPGAVYVPSLHTEVSFEVELVDDDIAEADEQLYLRIDWVTGRWGASGAFAAGTIFDDDQASLSVGDVSGAEGGFLNFVVSLDRPSDRTATVHYDTEDASPRSALAGVDYRARSGTAVIAAGELAATVAVFAPQDRLDEDDETFLLQLSDPTGGASLADAGAVAVGTIVDDDELPALSVSDASVGEGGVLVFAVTLDAPSGREVSVGWSVRDGTARAAEGDYLAAASRVVFAAGATRQTVSVQTLADSVVESAETVFLDLGSPSNAATDVGSGRGEIRDVSDRRVSVSDASVVEGGTLAFEVGFSEGPSGRDVVVRYRTRAGTAAAGGDYDDDYESVSQELRIVAGDTSATVLVPTVPDRLDEDNESLELVLSDPQGAVIVAGVASGVIIDDDPLPALSVSDTEASEGVGASAVFTLSLSEASGRRVTVAYDTADGTAKKDDDYTAVSGGSLVIDAGEDQATVDVALVDDDDTERVETFRLEVSGVTNASSDDSVGVATVTDDDGLVQVLVDDPAPVYEGEGVSAVFTVRLSRADATDAVTVMYSTADGTAAAVSDYTAATDEPLTFAAGEEAKTVSVPLVNDDVVEDVETFRLVLSSPSSNAELGDPEASVLVIDDDGLPAVSVADAAAATEGSTASFTATLSRAVPQEVTVDYAAVADPLAADEAAATPGQDYTAVSDTLRFAPRATEATVTVPLRQDSFDENTETFWLRLAGPVGATILDGTATGAIADDDPLPELSIGDAGATEGAPVSFEVRMAPASGRTVTVPWATEALPPGAGAASPDADYTAATGTVTLPPGTTTARVEVATLPDDVSESDERFKVHLGTPTNAALDDSTAIGAIVDDDGLPRISIAGTELLETDSPATFVVTLSHTSSQSVTVDYATTAVTATAGDDYGTQGGEATGTLVIPAGLDTGEISLYVADDNVSEGTETFHITLSNAVNAVIAEGAGTAVGTILDTSTARVTIAAAQAHENDGTISFGVTLSPASTHPVTVRYTTFDGTAAQPDDYTATTGTLTIAAGDVSASIPVVLVDDGVTEQETETFRLVLDDPVGVELATEEATGTIRDDDPPPRVSAEPFDAYSVERNGFAYHRVTLSHPSDLTVTVDYRLAIVIDRVGLYHPDFLYVSTHPGTLTFTPGVVAQTLRVPLFDNTVVSIPQQASASWPYVSTVYRLTLVDRVNASGGIISAIGVVWDDEQSPYVDSVAGLDTLEGAGSATFTITLNRFSDTAVTATYRTLDGTASAGTDYTATKATVTFPPGTNTASVTVPILDDADVESNESFRLRIVDDPRNRNLTYLATPLVGAEGGNPLGWMAIIDDDTAPELSVADTEANENAGTMLFWVALSRASAHDVTVRYATANGTATAGNDYTAADSTLTILAGATGASVSVPIIDDTDDAESDETFTLNLIRVTGATIPAAATATATIIENSDLPTLTMQDVSRSENIEVASPGLDFRPVLSGPSIRDVDVDWQVVEVPSLGDEAATIDADVLPARLNNTMTSRTAGTHRIPAGATDSGVIAFEIIADAIPERDERFQVILSNPRGATLGNTRAWGTILNDDVPIVTIADAAASESDDAVVFTLQLHEPGVDPASLHYTTVVRTSEDGEAATPGDDYTTASGILDIPAGATTATISVPIIGDSFDEPDETFLLVLTDPDTLEFRDRLAVGTITDDDPGFWIIDRDVWENAAMMTFTVRRDHTSIGAVAVGYRFGAGGSAVGGTACTDGVDFVWPAGSASGTVTMPAAGTFAAIGVEVCNDDDPEGRENVLVELTGVAGRKTTAVGTIVDND